MNILEMLQRFGHKIKKWWRGSKDLQKQKKYYYADKKEKAKVYIGGSQ